MRLYSYVFVALFITYGASSTSTPTDTRTERTRRHDNPHKNGTHQKRNLPNETNNKSLLNWEINRDDIPLDISNPDGDFVVQKRDIDDAVAEGLRRMHDLYFIKEPQLYHMGLYLDEDEPAGRVASFSKPNQRVLQQAHYGYAAVQATLQIQQKYPENRSRRNPELVSFLRTDAFADQCPLRGIPRCPPAARRYRTADGTCNNMQFPWKGASTLPMQRFLLPDYDDNVQSIRRAVRNGGRLPSPREVSIRIHRDRDVEMPAVTMMFVQWGQFIDHDITSTAQSRAFNASIPRCCARGGSGFLPPEFMHPECLPIAVPEDDWFLGRLGVRCIEFVRSAASSRINCDLGWREQINQVTSFIDASTVYGSDADRADSLRIFRNGLLQYGRSRRASQVPPDPPGGELCRLGALSTQCFRGGDTRVGEQPGLTAFHTIWLRYHNRIAAVIGNLNPHWSDEKVYQEGRRIIAALIQHITYKEFLPIVLGHDVMDLFALNVERKGFYNGYDHLVNPAPANAFSSAAFRFGHSLVQHSFMRSDAKHRLLVNNVTIHEELDNPENIWSFGSVDRLILGLCNQPSQRRDEFISRELTNHLFQQPGQPFGMDLAALNIQRGRDHGVPGYTAWREPCGLSRIRSWSDLEPVMNFDTIQRFRSLYEHVDDIDLYPGGLAERPIRGGIVGPTFGCIIAQQFSNLRRGDRFWYENGGFESSFTPAQLQQLRRVTFAHILCQVLPEIESVQPFVFLSPDNFRNARLACSSRDMETMDFRPWEERRVNRPLEKPSQPQFPPQPPPPPPVQSKPVGPVTVRPEASATRSIAINVNDQLDDFETKVEFINDGSNPTLKPQTHLSQMVDTKLHFKHALNGTLTDGKHLEIDGQLDFTHPMRERSNLTSPANFHAKPIKSQQQQQQQRQKVTITTPKPPIDTTAKSKISNDFDVLFLTGTNSKSFSSQHVAQMDATFDEMFNSHSTTSAPSKAVIKRSAPRFDINPLVDEYSDDDYDHTTVFTDQNYDDSTDISRKQSPNNNRKKQQKKPSTTKRPSVHIQNHSVSSNGDSPLKIKVTNITTSTIDLGPNSRPPNFPAKPHQTFQSSTSDKHRPTVYYQTTGPTSTYNDKNYVLHPTINKPNLHNVPSFYQSFQPITETFKSPDYLVNINIHLMPSTPKTEILINNKLVRPNSNIHIVDNAFVTIEESGNLNQYTIRPTKRPDYYRPKPTHTSSPSLYQKPTVYSRPKPIQTPSTPYYQKPTTYNYDRFEDRPFSTSKRPTLYRPSENFLSIFEEMHTNPYQHTTKAPTYLPGNLNTVKRPPNIPSYLYYNDGKYGTSTHSDSGPEVAPFPYFSESSNTFYIRDTVQHPNTHLPHNTNTGDKNFVKISSVLGNRYLTKTDKEQYIHTAQRKSEELDLQLTRNATNLDDMTIDLTNVKQFHSSRENDRSSGMDDRKDSFIGLTHDLELRTNEDTVNISDIESIDTTDDSTDSEKIQIDVIPHESQRNDWVLYDSVDDTAFHLGFTIPEEPEVQQSSENLADELPQPLSEFWKGIDNDGQF